MDKNNVENFLIFLKGLHRKYRRKHLHLIVDNLTVHKHKAIIDWLASQKITMHFPPTFHPGSIK